MRRTVPLLAFALSLLAIPAAVSSPPATAEISPAAEPTWGVTGLLPSGSNNFGASVWDFEQVGDVMYVGGKFTEAVSGPGGQTVAQPALAAFDVATGQLITTFTPDVRGGAVYALESSPDGSRLFVGGEFTSIGGIADTGGLAALDPTTGAIDPTWRAGLERPWTTDLPVARALDVNGDHLYVAGNFTHIRSAASYRQVTRLGRVDLETGTPDAAFLPQVAGGGIWDIDPSPDGSRIYLAGYFTSVNGNTESGNRFAAVATADGELVGGVEPFEPNLTVTGRQYAVVATGSKVFVAGEEHMMQVLNASDLQREKVYFTGSPSFVHSWPLHGGGDYQALEVIGNRVYAGCHCWSYHLTPSTGGDLFPTTQPPSGDWTPIRAVAAYDAATGSYLDSFNLDVSGASGAWAIAGDSNGCLWVGGDLTQSNNKWINGFGQWCDEDQATDSERPSPPKGLVVDAVSPGSASIRWTASTDNIAVTGYQIYRSIDGTAGPLIGSSSTPSFTDDQAVAGVNHTYTVKAVDAAGNTSWRSNFLAVDTGAVSDTQRPSPPKGLKVSGSQPGQISLVWGAATDNVGVTSYQIFRSADGTLGSPIGTTSGTSYNDAAVGNAGQYTYAVKAIDAAGNISWRSNYALGVTGGGPGADTERPTTPKGLKVEIANGKPVLTWTAATDNVGVVSYQVFRSTDGSFGPLLASGQIGFVDSGAAGETMTYGIKAVDAAGNTSWRSNLVTITVP